LSSSPRRGVSGNGAPLRTAMGRLARKTRSEMLRRAATMAAVDPEEPVPTRVEVEDVDALVVTNRPLWPFVAVGVIAVAAGVGAWLFVPREAPAWRVSIVAVGDAEA